jgi:hypothetical protein
MPSTTDRVVAMENMFSSDGWKKYYTPELQTMRGALLELLVYDEADEATMKGRQHCLRLLDEILAVEKAVADQRQGLAEQPQEAANSVVQSAHATNPND